MRQALELDNVKTYQSRVEALISSNPKHCHFYDVIVGRCVTQIPKLCHWIRQLLTEKGRLVYMTGGTLSSRIHSKVEMQVGLDELLGESLEMEDKCVVVLQAKDVETIGKEYTKGDKYC